MKFDDILLLILLCLLFVQIPIKILCFRSWLLSLKKVSKGGCRL